MNSQSLAREHYSRADVQKEIADFCVGRWVAVHCTTEKGELVFRRYFKGRPLTVSNVSDLQELLRKMNFQARTIYASANKYRLLSCVEDVHTLSNVIGCTPTWDIDSTLQEWRKTVAVAKQIIAFLESQGICNSVYVKWSGNGCHIHIHEEAFSEEVLSKAHPLDLAYAIVEYVNSNVLSRLSESLTMENVHVENRMDAGRVFTCPLSLHRELDVVCVCMKPNELDNFSPEWIKPHSFRHNPQWREHVKGEADKLALKAYEAVGGYPKSTVRKKRKKKSLDQQIIEWLQKF
ncbi:MAG: hypothetical protein QXS01_04830 [Candidatus Bathyarchaeia archaeon]|nr:hypothetical protein [Candidatus Bathyarchaeota archaeon]